MAFLIPENLRSSKAVSSSSRRVANALAMLDDDVTVWYEPPFDPDGELPDFVVLDPSLGVLVVAVIPGTVLGALRGRIRLEIDGLEQEVASPIDRTGRFGEQLQGLIANAEGFPEVPVSGVVAFPDTNRDAAAELDIDAVVRLDHCLFHDDLQAATRSGDGAIILRRFTQLLEGGLDERLTHDVEARLRGLIHPDAVIGKSVSQGSLFGVLSSEDDIVKVMDRKQERMARDLGSGHRVIRGVAGSGKTLVLTHRARLLARTQPRGRFLVTCYTRSLAGFLREQLSEHGNVDVVHLDKLLQGIVRGTGRPFPSGSGDAYWAELHHMALAALEAGDGPRYDAVLVDEAQDFDTTSLAACVHLLSNSTGGDLVVVADSAQNIFRRNFRWKQAQIQAQGRTRILRVNYRNTREILTFAHQFLLAGGGIQLDEDPDVEDEQAIVPPESAERTGSVPSVRVAATADTEITAVVEEVRAWYHARMRPRSIAVLCASASYNDFAPRLFAALEKAALPTFDLTNASDRDAKDRVGDATEPILLSTIYSAKGLEFSKVVVCGFGNDARTTQDNRKLLYVGFTRAVDELSVVTQAGHPQRHALEEAARAAHTASGS